MKRLLFIIALFLLMGCNEPIQTQLKEKFFPPKFSFGQKVYVSEGFYSGCSGRVIAAKEWSDKLIYTIDATCKSMDDQYTYKKEMQFLSQDLVPDAS